MTLATSEPVRGSAAALKVGRPTARLGEPVQRDTVSDARTAFLWLFCAWFVAQLFFNDIGNAGSVRFIGVNLRPDRLLLILAVILAVGRMRRARLIPVEYCMLFLFGWGMISLVAAGTIHHPTNRHLSSLLSLIGIPAVIFMMIRRLALDVTEILFILRLFVIISAYLTITGTGEHFNIGAIVFPKYILDPTVGLHFGRVRGPFGNAAVMGAVLTITLLCAGLFASTVYRQKTLHRAACMVLMLGAASAVYFTYTRSAWVMLGAAVAVGASFGRAERRRLLVASVLLLAIYLSGAFSKFSVQHDTLFSSRSGPVENREDMMRAAINMTIAKPIVGFGYGTFEKYNDDFFADYNAKRFSNGEGNHNAVLGVLAELGLLGGLPYVAIWFFFLFTSVKLARRPDVDAFRRHLGILGSQVLVGYVVTVQFFDPRFFGFLNCLVFFLAAVTYSQQTAVLSPVLQASSSPVVRGRRAWQLTPGSASSRSGARLGWTSRTPRKATAQPGALSRR